MRVEHAVAATPGVVGARPMTLIPGINGRSDVAVADVYPKGSPQDAATADLLHTVRDQIVPSATRETRLRVLVGGNTAIFDDFSHVLARKLPLFVGVVVLLSVTLLMAVFRSIAIPRRSTASSPAQPPRIRYPPTRGHYRSAGTASSTLRVVLQTIALALL